MYGLRLCFFIVSFVLVSRVKDLGVKLFMVIKVVGKFCNSQKILESVRIVAL